MTRSSRHIACCGGRIVLLAACLAAAWPGRAAAQGAPDGNEAAVRSLIEQFYDAYAREDLAAMKGLWSARLADGDRSFADLARTMAGKDFSFANVVVSRIDLKQITGSARVTLDATIVDLSTKVSRTEKWVRTFTCVKDSQEWRIWRDIATVNAVVFQIRQAASAAQADAIVSSEPDLPAGEIAQALFGLGNRLRLSGQREDATAVYALSAQVAEKSGDPVVVGQSHTNVGVNAQMGGDYEAALQSFLKARALFGEAGDREHIAGTEVNLGNVLYLKQQYTDAIAHHQKALEYYESIGHKAAMASALHSIGNARYLANDLSAAIESYRRALALHEAIPGSLLGEASTLQAIGLVQQEQGDYDGALESYAASLSRHEKSGNEAGTGPILASLGDVHRLMGSFTAALERYFQALPLLTETGDRAGVGSTLADIANVYAAEHRYPPALEYFAKSLPIVERTGNKTEIARVIAGTGSVHFAQAKYKEAMEAYQRTLQLYESISSAAGIAWTLVHIGLVHQAESRFVEAQDAYEKGLAIVETLNDKPSIAITLALLARARAALDRPREAVELAGRAATLAAEIDGLDTVARAKLVTGEASRTLKEDAEAQQALAGAVAALEQLQTQGSGAERDRFFGDTLAPFLDLVGIAAETGKAEEALTWLERGKAYLLRAFIGGTGTVVTRGMMDSERETEHNLGRRVLSLTTQVRRETGNKTPDLARLAQLQADLTQTRADRAAFTAALYAAHPDLKVLRVQGDPIVMDSSARLTLPPASAVVEFGVSEAKTFVFVVRVAARAKPPAGGGGTPAGAAVPPASVILRVLDVRAADLASKITLFRGLIAKKDPGVASVARELYDLVLKPVEGDLAGATRLILVPDAVLWALPFQALQPRDGRYLIEDRAVSYAPSLAAFLLMDAAGREAQPTAAAFGLATLGKAAADRLVHVRPDVKVDLLPEALKEAPAVAALYGPARGQSIVGDAATWESFAGNSPGKGVLHLALPGVLNDSSPMTSEVAFSPRKGDEADDGLAETWELMNRPLDAEVVVFSRLQGEPVQARVGSASAGLSWAMLVAGAPTTVLSSWIVDAQTTTTLMLGFHRRMSAAAATAAARSAADALRRATVAVMALPETRHPYYWAGFSVFGR